MFIEKILSDALNIVGGVSLVCICEKTQFDLRTENTNVFSMVTLVGCISQNSTNVSTFLKRFFFIETVF